MSDCLGPPIEAYDDDSPDSECGSSVDPLETEDQSEPSSRARHLFDDSYGELGLAASIFRIMGSPDKAHWPVSSSPLRPLRPSPSPPASVDVVRSFDLCPMPGRSNLSNLRPALWWITTPTPSRFRSTYSSPCYNSLLNDGPLPRLHCGIPTFTALSSR